MDKPALPEPVSLGYDIENMTVIKGFTKGQVIAHGDAMAAWGAAQEREKLKPLTDEQLMDLLGNCANGGWFKYHAFARAIENAHGVGH